MGRRRKKRSKVKSITINKFKVGIGLFLLGGLYFFSFYLAEGSPIFEFLSSYASIAFGTIGLNVFFGLCMLSGLLILLRGYLMKIIIKQFIVVMILVSAIINFQIVDGISKEYEAFGGYLSWPLIFLLDKMFGGQAMAIKVFIIILFVVVLGWILYVFNFTIPKFNIKINSDKKPQKKKKEKKEIKQEFKYDDSDITKKINEARSGSNREYSKSDSDKKILKSIIKQKVNDKFQEKSNNTEVKFKPRIKFSSDKPTFGVSLLDSNQGQTRSIDENFLMEKAKSLQNKLMEFNVPVSIEGFDIGPSIVQIKIKPEAGIRVSTIEKLKNDISLSLRTKSLSILAPIPGTDSVGIQLPNPKPAMVHLGDILNSSVFADNMKKNQTNLSLGKAIDGSIIIKYLENMPHLLVAGATGSGKSVGVNDFILSLMYQNTPSELKFLMVDPKQVELELYSGLPYMLGPIVTDPDKSLRLLKRAVEEMEKRYTLLKEKRVKKLEEYNAKVIGDKMFRIVFVIDELADLMMSGNKKEVEGCITRIAQKARAVGIHLIVATQRPSVNVITGLIKANIPTRIAFGVVSEVDSRTILGRKGAEDLVGRGDMLYTDSNTKHALRIQAPFVDTKEIERVVQTLKNKYMSGITEDDIYEPSVVSALEKGLETTADIMGGGSGSGSDEELIQQAIKLISQTRKASATLLQRRLNVGFARAARIMDALEERGVVGPQDGAKPREIFL